MISLLVLAAACSFEAQVPQVAGEPKELLKMSIIDVKTGSGAAAEAGKRYIVHYTGWLKDGTKFDSSRDRNTPFQFVQGRRQVIAGWEAGFEGMKVGGQRRLLIPYQMAYGDKGSGKTIPPKADLIFDVELLGVEDVPDAPAAADVIEALNGLEKKLVAIAESLPADKFDWRPAPGVRSFNEVLRHIENDNQLWLAMVTATPSREQMQKLMADGQQFEKKAADRAEIAKSLRESFAALKKAITPVRAGVLAGEMDMFGQKTTRRTVYTMFLTHASEHLGQLIAYERVNGIVPPWSK